MTKLEEVAEATYRLAMGLSQGYLGHSTYFIVGEDRAVLIEPGQSALVPLIRDGIERLGIRRLSHIIPTHIHMDHAGGSGDLAKLFPEATVILHPRAARHAIDPTRLITATKLSFGDDFEDTHGAIQPIPESQIKVVDDGETLDIGGREVQFFYAPGHAAHQIAILDRRTGSLFCGEALGVPIPGECDSALPSVSIPELDVEQYLATIDKLCRLEPRLLCFSHGAGARESRGIISRLAENTVLLRDLVLDGLKNGDDLKTIERLARSVLTVRLGAGERAFGLAEIVLGYATYFRKEGLI